MARTREIRKRMQAVRTIQRITKTMQMIATAMYTSALPRARATKPYTEKLAMLVWEALAASSGYASPLIGTPGAPTGKLRLLVISSDRGLCGSYNTNVLREAIGFVREQRRAGATIELEAAGKKAMGFAKYQKLALSKRHALGDKPDFDAVAAIADGYMAERLAGTVDSVWVASMQFVSVSKQKAAVNQLLPLQPAPRSEADAKSAALVEFSPSTESILEELLPMTVRAILYQAVLDAGVSEHLMRKVAMKAATDNARELSRTLNRKYNRARQTQITTELMEVVSGAAALGT
jgi:F-type H+-transporting ATPase subunit gamma